MKTTNAKAKDLQTPAPFGGTLKPEKTQRRTSTAQRLKKAAPVTQKAQTKIYNEAAQDDVPDIEYMPPKPTGTMHMLRSTVSRNKADGLQISQISQMKLHTIQRSHSSNRETVLWACRVFTESRKSALMVSRRSSASSRKILPRLIRWRTRRS